MTRALAAKRRRPATRHCAGRPNKAGGTFQHVQSRATRRGCGARSCGRYCGDPAPARARRIAGEHRSEPDRVGGAEPARGVGQAGRAARRRSRRYGRPRPTAPRAANRQAQPPVGAHRLGDCDASNPAADHVDQHGANRAACPARRASRHKAISPPSVGEPAIRLDQEGETRVLLGQGDRREQLAMKRREAGGGQPGERQSRCAERPGIHRREPGGGVRDIDRPTMPRIRPDIDRGRAAVDQPAALFGRAELDQAQQGAQQDELEVVRRRPARARRRARSRSFEPKADRAALRGLPAGIAVETGAAKPDRIANRA